MALGKTIRIYLIDGTASGAMAVEVINWTGQVVFFPRPQLADLAKRPELQRTGVYFLVGTDNGRSRERVYVGEGDVVFERLKEHDKRKDFWTQCVGVTSKDENLTKAHVRYLEHRLHAMVLEAGRAESDNGNAPAPKPLPEADRADMEYFLEQVKLILPVLGFEFLRPPATRDIDAGKAEPRSPKLLMDEVGVRAEAYEIDGRFVVLSGSTARAGQPTASWDSYVDFRDRLVEDGKLVQETDEFLRFCEDVEFNSPSAAASVVAAANRNGRIHWKLTDGQTYADWKEQELDRAEAEAVIGFTAPPSG